MDPREGDSIEQVRELTEGRGVDYALEAAGDPDAQTEAIMMSRKAGTVVLTGLATFGTTVSVNQVELALRGRTIQSCQNGMSRMGRDIPRYARMLEDGVVDARPIISAHYALEDINDALAQSEAHNDLSGVIVPGAA
jgi:Zn-dependent alcohol dehydrogenase